MKAKLLMAIVVLLSVMALGFMVWDSTDPYSLDDSVSQSEVIADAALSTDGQTLYLDISTENDARQNDVYCITTTSGKITTTTCYDDWHNVEISKVSLVKEGDGFFAEDTTISTETVGNGEYTLYVESDRGWTTSLTIQVEKVDGSFEVTGSNWSNER